MATNMTEAKADISDLKSVAASASTREQQSKARLERTRRNIQSGLSVTSTAQAIIQKMQLSSLGAMASYKEKMDKESAQLRADAMAKLASESKAAAERDRPRFYQPVAPHSSLEATIQGAGEHSDLYPQATGGPLLVSDLQSARGLHPPQTVPHRGVREVLDVSDDTHFFPDVIHHRQVHLHQMSHPLSTAGPEFVGHVAHHGHIGIEPTMPVFEHPTQIDHPEHDFLDTVEEQPAPLNEANAESRRTFGRAYPALVEAVSKSAFVVEQPATVEAVPLSAVDSTSVSGGVAVNVSTASAGVQSHLIPTYQVLQHDDREHEHHHSDEQAPSHDVIQDSSESTLQLNPHVAEEAKQKLLDAMLRRQAVEDQRRNSEAQLQEAAAEAERTRAIAAEIESQVADLRAKDEEEMAEALAKVQAREQLLDAEKAGYEKRIAEEKAQLVQKVELEEAAAKLRSEEAAATKRAAQEQATADAQFREAVAAEIRRVAQQEAEAAREAAERKAAAALEAAQLAELAEKQEVETQRRAAAEAEEETKRRLSAELLEASSPALSRLRSGLQKISPGSVNSFLESALERAVVKIDALRKCENAAVAALDRATTSFNQLRAEVTERDFAAQHIDEAFTALSEAYDLQKDKLNHLLNEAQSEQVGYNPFDNPTNSAPVEAKTALQPRFEAEATAADVFAPGKSGNKFLTFDQGTLEVVVESINVAQAVLANAASRNGSSVAHELFAEAATGLSHAGFLLQRSGCSLTTSRDIGDPTIQRLVHQLGAAVQRSTLARQETLQVLQNRGNAVPLATQPGSQHRSLQSPGSTLSIRANRREV